jgi:SAM-dependent methyltransferase
MQQRLDEVKERQRRGWAEGDFAAFATVLVPVSEALCEAVDLRAGRSVLDVATGSGNTALAAARRGCDVVGIDYVEPLLERARERARAERLTVSFVPGDAERLPFTDGAFDYVLSTFGAMFAPDQAGAAGELLRVCRPGGRIGLSTFPPTGFAGDLFRITARYAPPPRGVPPVARWGTPDGLAELFPDGTDRLVVEPAAVTFRFRSDHHWLSFFRRHFGPVRSAFDQLDERAAGRLEEDILDHIRAHNRSGDETIVAEVAYSSVVIDRAGPGPAQPARHDSSVARNR